MVVVEAAAPWQFYLRSPQITALARRRQELGFSLEGYSMLQQKLGFIRLSCSIMMVL